MGKPKTTTTVGTTLRPLPGTCRRRIKALYRERSGPPAPLNDEHRRLLAACIYEVENDLESRLAANPDRTVAACKDPAVAAMNAVRNVLLDDCGENEAMPADAVARLTRELGHPPRYAAVEAMAARIAGKRVKAIRRAAA